MPPTYVLSRGQSALLLLATFVLFLRQASTTYSDLYYSNSTANIPPSSAMFSGTLFRDNFSSGCNALTNHKSTSVMMRSSGGTTTEVARLHSSRSPPHGPGAAKTSIATETTPEMIPTPEIAEHVMLGRGKRSVENPGNKIFRAIVHGRKAEVCLCVAGQFGGCRLLRNFVPSAFFLISDIPAKNSPNSIGQRRIERPNISLRGK